MKNNMNEIVSWIATGVAVSVGIFITHNPWCLLALLIPMIAYDD